MSSAIQRLQELPKSELVQKLARVRASISRVREDSKHATNMAMIGAASAAGGALAGWLAYNKPTLPIPGAQGMHSDGVIGGALLAAAAFDLLGKHNEQIAYFASGLTAVAIARETAKHFAAQKRAAGAPVALPNW